MAMLSMLKTELVALTRLRPEDEERGGKNKGGEKEEKQQLRRQRRRQAQKVARSPARNTLLTEGQARL